MDKIRIHFSQVDEAMTLMDLDEIEKAVDGIKLVRSVDGTIYLFGNGGSHATASHFSNDLNKMCRVKAVCIGDMVPTVTAYGNDDGWGNMFANHLRKVLKTDDGVIGFSCSGFSENVINALSAAKSRGILTIGFTGLGNTTEINKIGVDCLVHARTPEIRVQEDMHMIICHAISKALQERE